MKIVLKVFAVLAIAAAVHPLYAQAAHAVEPVGVNPWDIVQAHISGGSIAIVTTLVTIYLNLRKVLRPTLKSITMRLDEHDIMWEEYNIRNGGSWRIERGRAGITALHERDSSVRARPDVKSISQT